MYVNKSLITKSISDAYDTFAGLEFEKLIHVEDYDLNDGSKKIDHTIFNFKSESVIFYYCFILLIYFKLIFLNNKFKHIQNYYC